MSRHGGHRLEHTFIGDTAFADLAFRHLPAFLRKSAA
jgi:hypothetical protein